MKHCLNVLATLGLVFLFSPLHAQKVHVAVASNFAMPVKAIAKNFEQDSAHQVVVSLGATGQLYSQIKNGAPFDVFLSADADTPLKLEREGVAVAGSRLTYAVGKLALWSAKPDLIDAKATVINTGGFNKIAMADPKLAPYGLAAVASLEAMGLLNSLKPKIIQAPNIAQVFQWVSSGNADIGFVALSQIYHNGQIKAGSAWIVPEHYYPPLQQDAVLLHAGRNNAAALAFLAYLKSNKSQALIRSFGYGLWQQ